MNGMLTVKQVADRLHVNKITVYGWIHNHLLTAYKAGNLWRITEEQLQDFLNQGHKEKVDAKTRHS